mmetsp:Transcript_1546/g.1552  ORF Transcript_1546/g.1552 Transcript_1546/m.1552 type:complete len:105 (+) Transcript_1546:89-403(+)
MTLPIENNNSNSNTTNGTSSNSTSNNNNRTLLQHYTDKLNNNIMSINMFIRELKFQHHNGQLMKRRRMLQKRQAVNHAKAIHQRKKHIQIESQKAAIKEYFSKV